MKTLLILCVMIFHVCATEHALSDFIVLKAQFKQKRSLAHLEQPLESVGEFVFIKEKGILWNVKTPYAKAVLISSTGLKILNPTDDDDQSSQNNTFGSYADVLGQILANVLNGNINVIDSMEGFDTEILIKNKTMWKKKIIPKDPMIKKIVPMIVIEGNNFITRVEIQKAKGEWDELLFTEHQSCKTLNQCAILTDYERNVFE